MKSKEINGREKWLPFRCSNCNKEFGAFYDYIHIGSRNAVIVCEVCSKK